MLPGKKFTFDEIGRILRQRSWIVLVSVFVCTFIALLTSRFLPNQYQSEALIQIVPQRVPDSYVQTTVTTRLDERLKTITQQIMSRTRLEQLVTELDVYPEERRSQPMEDVVAMMRTNIGVTLTPVTGAARARNADPDSFRVQFSYSDPQVAQRVAAQLANLFIAENTRLRGIQAESTNDFLETQLAEARAKLVEQEKKVEAFRKRYTGRLPAQMQTNMQAIQNTQLQLQSLIASLENDRSRKLITERLLSDAVAADLVPSVATLPTIAGVPGADAAPAGATARQQLEAARQSLQRLSSRLTAEHPDIRRLQNVIAELEPLAAAEVQASSSIASGASVATAPTARVLTPDQERRREQISAMRAELGTLSRSIVFKEAEERRLRAQVADYQARIEAVPGLESEWTSLSRDYETQQEAYRLLLQKSESSKVAANLERRQIGEQFNILDSPRVPSRPLSPQRLLINAAGFMIGLVFGLAIVGLLVFLDSTYRTEGDVVNALSLPVLAVVPHVATSGELRGAQRRRRLGAIAVAVVLVACAGVAASLQLWRYVA
jgi:polysaccharide chain length determinant protein (PEP-CTERM system associated)